METTLYSVMKRFWINVKQILKRLQVPTRWVRAGERTVEYPFVIGNIIKYERGRVLDVGCAGTNLPTELASLGFQVFGIDTRKYYVKYPQVFFVQGDVCNSPFKSISFDVVVAVSTIEHIGLGEHGETLTDCEGDKRALEEILRMLKPNGVLLLTVPYGNPSQKPPFRVYNSRSINRLIDGFKIAAVDFYAHLGKYWVPISKEKAESIRFSRPSNSVALLRLIK